jgi:mannose-1-phosphate guanylyltransferase
MKAILLSAGLGTRLRPLTDNVPKCLVPIKGRPLLSIWLDLLGKFGITDVLINSHTHCNQLSQFLNDRSGNVRFTIAEEPKLLGSAGTLAANQQWIGSESFWILYADVLTNINLEKMFRFHSQHPSTATLAVYRVKNPRECGIVVVDRTSRITSFIEKPEHPPDNLAFSGILLATPALLDAIPPKRPADIGFDVFPQLAGKMFAYETDEYVLDIGTMENYQRAQCTWAGF